MLINTNTQVGTRNFHTNKATYNSSSNVSFNDVLTNTQNTPIDKYLKLLEQRLGVNVQIGNFENGDAARNGSQMFGQNNVSIAPNILEKMSTDPNVRNQYEGKIQNYLHTSGEANAFMAMRGRQITSRGVIIHADGTVTSYCSSEPTPEEQAKIDKAMKEQEAEKAEKCADEKRLNELSTEEVMYSNSEMNFLQALPVQNNIFQGNNEFTHIAYMHDLRRKIFNVV